jgi:hypothetical protein
VAAALQRLPSRAPSRAASPQLRRAANSQIDEGGAEQSTMSDAVVAIAIMAALASRAIA